jgi:hypothetical protein
MTVPTAYDRIRPDSWLLALALALLLAASAGAGIAVARPGTTLFGLGCLAAVPLGALLLGRYARAAAVAAAMTYAVALIWAYTSHFSPLFAYEGLVDSAPSFGAKLIIVALAAAPAVWLPLSARRPSTLVLWALYLLGYVPTIVVPLFIKGRLGLVLPFDGALAGSMAVLTLILWLPPAPIGFPHLSLTAFTRLLTFLGVLSVLYLLAAFGVHAPPSLAKVYSTRVEFATEQAGAIASGYLVPWAGNVINPMLMALGIARRRITLVMIALAGELLIYASSGYKSVLFSVALVPLVYLAISLASRWFGVVASTATAAVLVCAVHARSLTGQWSLALASRTFATPGQIGYYYYEYFALHQKDHLSHSFLRWFVHSPYTQPPPLVIGAAYFPASQPDANAHVWADAFANFGFGGIAVFTLVLGLALWIADGLGRWRDARIAGPMLVIAGLSLGGTGLFTTLLTQGLGLGCLLVALMPPMGGAAASSPGRRLRHAGRIRHGPQATSALAVSARARVSSYEPARISPSSGSWLRTHRGRQRS